MARHAIQYLTPQKSFGTIILRILALQCLNRLITCKVCGHTTQAPLKEEKHRKGATGWSCLTMASPCCYAQVLLQQGTKMYSCCCEQIDTNPSDAL